MDAYFDLANFVSYVKSRGKDADYDECTRLLKRNFNIKFRFSKEDLRKFPDELKFIEEWAKKEASQGIRGEIEYQIDFPSRPIPQKFYENANIQQLSSIYLLDDTRIPFLQRDGVLLIGSVGEEIKTLSKLMVDDYECTKILDPRELDSWGEIQKFTTPCTDIILIDQYILNRNNSHGNNLCKLLQVLSSNAKQFKINIVIFATKKAFEKSFEYAESEKKDFLSSLIRKIQEAIKAKVKAAPNVTIVLVPFDLREHDRDIFTNYRKIHSGDSFSYFDEENNNCTRGRNLVIHSHAQKDVFGSFMTFINDMQALVDKTQDRNQDLIIGEKVSNFLHFKHQ